MKLPVEKSTAVAGGGMLAIASIIAAAQLGKPGTKPERAAEGGSGVDEASGSILDPAAPRGSASTKRCPNEQVTEDASLKMSPEALKRRFVTTVCSRTSAGEINACLDADEGTCKQRLAGLGRVLKDPGTCVARPAEIFCSAHVLADDRPVTSCFETKQACDAHHERKRGRARICRVSAGCERFALSAL